MHVAFIILILFYAIIISNNNLENACKNCLLEANRAQLLLIFIAFAPPPSLLSPTNVEGRYHNGSLAYSFRPTKGRCALRFFINQYRLLPLKQLLVLVEEHQTNRK